jgi:hypothetical protein
MTPYWLFMKIFSLKIMSIPAKTSLISMIQNDAILTIIDPNSTSNAANDPRKKIVPSYSLVMSGGPIV